MGRYTTIPQSTFSALQLDAGVLLKHFDIAAAAAANNATGFTDADLICATTGGVKVDAKPTFQDLGESVDNVPLNMKELKKLQYWDCKISTTSLGTSPELIRMALGCADIGADGTSIIPRMDLSQGDFSDIWWVGDRADGGLVAAQIMNALSTGGFSLQTSKNDKGQTSIEITGHVGINAQKVVPMQFYSIDPAEKPTYTVTFDVDGGSAVESQQVESGGRATEPTDPTKTGFTFGGWFADSGRTAAWDFDNSTVLADTTIYAKWVTA